ncbi:LamG domain-containing protein [Microbispora sp. H10830]|uniref:LamG domain-containing protein n=1 Tax=Microbispora sp. H10830 TaxID=2729109 RepID=UPI0016030E3D|nr:LamG domain-containing protein [Microbispora sp. H10830]
MRLCRALFAVVLAWAAVAASLVATPSVAAAAQAAPAQPDERSALAAAATSGTRVEVLDRRTETRQVFANSDGTFTLEESALPVRVRRDGRWADVDATLVQAPGGRITPRATAVAASLSAGGDSALATLSAQGRELAISWPGTLPVPRLEGATATYPEVFPGVDLQLTASVTGLSEVLVVKDAKAAANPALAKITFGLSGTGVSIRKAADGTTNAVTDGGTVLFTSPVPRMWDSSGRANGSAGEAVSRSPAAAPSPGGREVAMDTEVTDSAISVIPDRSLLADPATQFPVFIDPQWTGSKLAWAMVSSDGSYTGWNPTHRSEAGSYNGSVKRRSFYRMRTDYVNYKHILKATFRITETWSWSCSARPIELWFTGPISQSTTWSHQPTLHKKLDELNVAKGYDPGGCDNGGLEFDATAAVADTAGRGLDDTTLGLIAGNETDSYYWKGFDQSTAKLVIDYNSVPRPTAGMATTPAAPCATGTGRPAISTASPALKAKVYDPDQGGDAVRAEFEVRVYNSTTSAWETFGATRTTSYIASATAVEHKVTLSGLAEGGAYSWRVRAYDGTDAGPWSSWCEFRIDTTNPGGLPSVSSAQYPDDEPTDPAQWHNGIGRPGSFTFTRAAGDTDVTAFDYAVDTISARRRIQAPSGTANLLIAPSHDWLTTVYVWPVDQAGNAGAHYATYQFYVSSVASGPVSSWSMDEAAAATTAADSAGSSPLTATGVTFAGGRLVKAASLNGTSSYLASSGPVVDTSKAFTISAWAQLTDTSHVSTVAAQVGDHASAFYLYFNSADGKWVFSQRPSDTDGVSPIRASSDAPARVNAWEHLVGVYDPSLQQLRLYVNGRLQSSQPAFATPWNATGSFQVGRSKIDSKFGNYFAGSVDEVRVWDRLLVKNERADELSDLVNRPPQHQAAWRLDEGAGTSAASSTSQTGRTLTLGGGAGWTSDGHDLNALSMNGTSGYAAAPGYMTRTDGSFTITTWARLGNAAKTATAASQDGTRRSAFTLGYRMFGSTGKWSFDAPDADSDTATLVSAAVDPAVYSVDLEQWTHLAGVYDHPRRQLRLYVNGQLVAQADGYSAAWNATGAFQLGRAKLTGAATGYWPGDIDDTHVYTGVLTDEEILNFALGLA